MGAHDLHRREWFRNYLKELDGAIQEGVLIRGCFLWSFVLDIFEWEGVFRTRFGVVFFGSQRKKGLAASCWPYS